MKQLDLAARGDVPYELRRASSSQNRETQQINNTRDIYVYRAGCIFLHKLKMSH